MPAGAASHLIRISSARFAVPIGLPHGWADTLFPVLIAIRFMHKWVETQWLISHTADLAKLTISRIKKKAIRAISAI